MDAQLIAKVGAYTKLSKSQLGKMIRVDSVGYCVAALVQEAAERSRTCLSHILVESGLTSALTMCKALERKGIIDLSIVETNANGFIDAHEVAKYTTRRSRLLICSFRNSVTLQENDLRGVSTNIPVLVLIDHRMQCKTLPSSTHVLINLPVGNGVVLYHGSSKLTPVNKAIPDTQAWVESANKIESADKFKTVFMQKLSGIVPCMQLSDYNVIYDCSICRLTCVVIGSASGALALAFVSAYNRKRIRLSFATQACISSPKMNHFIRLGFVLIDFRQCANTRQLSEWIHVTPKELTTQYPRLVDEVKINKLASKKPSSPTTKKVRFSTKLAFEPATRHKTTFPKSSLRRKSKYR